MTGRSSWREDSAIVGHAEKKATWPYIAPERERNPDPPSGEKPTSNKISASTEKSTDKPGEEGLTKVV